MSIRILYTVSVPLEEGAAPTVIQLTATGRIRFVDGTPNRAIRAFAALSGEPCPRTRLLDAWQQWRRPTVARLLFQAQFPHLTAHISFYRSAHRNGSATAGNLFASLVLPREWWRVVYCTGRALAGDAFCLDWYYGTHHLLVPASDGAANIEHQWVDEGSNRCWMKRAVTP